MKDWDELSVQANVARSAEIITYWLWVDSLFPDQTNVKTHPNYGYLMSPWGIEGATRILERRGWY